MNFPKIALLFSYLSFYSILISQTESWGPSKALLFEEVLISQEEIPEIETSQFDLQQIIFEDSINDHNKVGPWRFGHSFEASINLNNSGIWEDIDGHGRIWRLKIKSEGALSLNFLIENYHISENGGYFTFYNPDEARHLFYYTEKNNLVHQKLGTELVKSESVILEVFEPFGHEGESSLSITNIIHGYRSLELFAQSMSRALNSSGDCNIDILCPEGNGWELEAKSVAMIVVNGSGACTGALVNNTQNDGTPYFLTANHCGTDPTNWAFRFNWDSPTPSCATTTPSTNGPVNMETANGGIFRAANAGSDFFLLEISNPPPASWDIYYSGWDKTDIAPDSVIGIHHPAGDVKKICKYYDVPSQTLYNAGGATNAECWEVPDWTMGVTEGGSSGSPLFDHNHRIIGQLFGGTAACDNTTSTIDNGQPDYYGRFGISWDGASSSERLKDWLDPNNTNPGFIDGYYPLTITDDYDAFAVVTQSLPLELCGENSTSPSLNIRNNGLVTLTSLTIKIDIDGIISTIPWTGSLLSGEYETISLGNISFNDGQDIPVKIYTELPNGQNDQNTSNDTIQKSVTVQTSGEFVLFDITADCNASENAIYIENGMGILTEQLATQGELGDGFFGTEISKNVCLEDDCYELVITDAGNDGWPDNWLCFATYGVQATYNSNLIIDESTFNFTDEVRYPFCIGTSSVDEFQEKSFHIYPNPTNGIMYVDLNVNDIKNLEIQLLDLSGRIVLRNQNQNQIDLSTLSSGTYIMKILSDNVRIGTQKIIRN